MQAANNLKKIYTLPVNQLNAETLLSKDMLIMTVEAARWAEDTLASEPHGRRGRKFAGSVAEEEEGGEEIAAEEPEEAEPAAEAEAVGEEDGE